MPIPTPLDNEAEDDFHGRCMSAIWDEYGKNPAQANAICYSAWREHHHKSIDTGTGLTAYDLQGQRKEAASMIGGQKRLYGLIEKIEEVGDGTVKVHGVASTEDEDDQGEIVRAAAMRAAIPDYMKFGAVREMHGLSAAGRALECNCDNDNITRIVAHVVDPTAVLKVKNRVYNGFSIGGRVVEREAGNSRAISRLALHEISLVDRPANPQAMIDLWKIGESTMPDGLGNGLGTMEAAFHDAMAKVQQTWSCGVPGHRHSRKEDAAKCMAKSVTMPPMKDLHTGAEKHLGAEKHGLPEGPAIKPSGSGTEKHGLPGQGVTQPRGEPPGGPNSEENFDGDHDADDNTTSAETAGGGYRPESASERRDDFGKKDGNGKKPYGDVRYADPGYQSDGKKRYPIDTEAHVRAAWSYINQADNARQYSSEQLGNIKGRIRSAAKEHGIEISEKAIFDLGDSDALIKSLANTSIDTLLTDLPYDLDLVIEKAGRRQSAADSFMKQVAHDAIGKLTDGQFCMKAEANATQDTGRNAEHEAPNQGTDSGTAHYRTGENATQDTNKRGARHSAATVGWLKKAHDNLCRAGAACPAHESEGMSKASTTEEGAMALTTDDDGAALQALKDKQMRKENKQMRKTMEAMALTVQQLQFQVEHMSKNPGVPTPPPPPAVPAEKTGKFKKMLDPLTQTLTAMQEKIDKIASTPIPGSASHLPPGFFDVSKAQDGRQGTPTPEQVQKAEELLKNMKDMSPQDRFRIDYAISQMRPYAQQR